MADVNQIYQQIKGLENVFPLPTPAASVDMGTFNTVSGKFEGIISTLESQDEGGPDDPQRPQNKPRPVLVPPVVGVNAVNATLVFHVSRRQGIFRVTINGHIALPGSDPTTIEVDVGQATDVSWSLQSGTHFYHDRVLLPRSPIIGAGAFTIPVLPLAVVYEPPPDEQRRNQASYSITTSLGTAVQVSFSTEQSATTPATAPFADLMTLKSVMTGLAGALDHVSAAAGGALRTIATGLGQASATGTTGSVNATDHTLNLVNIVQDTITTGANDGGPGVGDILYFLKNARLVWLASAGKITLGLLGHDGAAALSVAFLAAHRTNPPAGLDTATVDALLALDPFVAGGPQVTLPAPRYAPEETYEVNGADVTHTVTHLTTQTDQQANTTFTARTVDQRKGFLSFIGIGVPETKTVKTTLTQRHAGTTTTSQSVTASVTFHAEANEFYAVEVTYDRVFGTFAFRSVPVTTHVVIGGTATTAQGRPQARKEVRLESGGRVFVTRTDALGRYAFRSTAIRAGALTLSVGTRRKQATFAGPGTRLHIDV